MIAVSLQALYAAAAAMVQPLPSLMDSVDRSPAAQMTEPAYIDTCLLQKTGGGTLRFAITQVGKRAYGRPGSPLQQTDRAVVLSGADASEFAGLDFGFVRVRSYVSSGSTAYVEPVWPVLSVAARRTGPFRSSLAPARITLTPVASAAGDRFSAIYYRNDDNSGPEDVIATGFCTRAVELQQPLTADETVRYLAR